MSKIKKISGWPPTWITPVSEEELKRSRGWECAQFINTFCSQTKETVAGTSGSRIYLREWQIETLNNLFALNKDGFFKHRTAMIGMARRTENQH